MDTVSQQQKKPDLAKTEKAPVSMERREFTARALSIAGAAIAGRGIFNWFCRQPLYAQEQGAKKLDVVITKDGWITVYNYPYRDENVMPSGTEQNSEIMGKLGARGGEKVEDSRRMERTVKRDGEDFTIIKTYVKFEHVGNLLVLVDRHSYYELAVAPASEWPKEAAKKQD